jgi:rhombotail lipoprotein
MKFKNFIPKRLLFVAVPLGLIVGCAMFDERTQRHTSSVVDYLFPNNTRHVEEPGVPVLSLPLKVGIAFVPEPNSRRHNENWNATERGLFTEEQKMALMKEVSDNFKKYPYVKSIELIPSAYLTPQGGFVNLDQLRSMFGVEVITLLSYDQVQFTGEGLFSISYWTIAGAYIVPGEKNDTQTMMDAVVYDIASRKLLFRAPGTSRIKGAATPINLSEQLRQDGRLGFQQAATNLVVKLQEQLSTFQERVKSAPEEFKIVAKPGYKGAGAVGQLEALMLAGMAVFCLWPRRSNRA